MHNEMPYPTFSTRLKWVILASVPQKARRYYVHRRVFGTPPNFEAPQLFSEKLAWRYLYDRRPVLAHSCDKLWSKEFAIERAERLGVKAPTTRWHGSDPDAAYASIEALSGNHRWVLKPNHLSSGRALFGLGTAPDILAVREFFKWCRSDEFRLRTTGWAYSRARKCFLVEDRINTPHEDLPDYKLHIFGGKVACIQVITDRWASPKKIVYAPDWTILSGETDQRVPRPGPLPQMIAIGEAIAKDFDYMRVDLYLHNGAIWFGELTPYPSFTNIVRDRELNMWLGSLWQLPAIEQ